VDEFDVLQSRKLSHTFHKTFTKSLGGSQRDLGPALGGTRSETLDCCNAGQTTQENDFVVDFSGCDQRRGYAVKAKLPSKAAVRERAENEMKEYAVITAYLFIVFAAVSYFKFAILKAQGVEWAPWVFALVKAAIAAKFILIGRALHIGEGQRNKP